MTAILKISDGKTEIDLLGSKGYILSAWRPAIAGYKGGGVWQASSISRGRQLVGKFFENAVESFNLKARAVSQDILVHETQELRRLLEKASDYWVADWQDEPVWIEARAGKESNTRYAIVHKGGIAEDGNPYSQPFLQPGCEAAMDGLTLVVERGDWQPVPPGESECVEISGMGVWPGYGNEFFVPDDKKGYDDCWVYGAVIDLTGNYVAFGTTAFYGTMDAGVRFRFVDIPQGATITSAFVRMVAYANNAGATCNADIYGENSSFPSQFSTFADFSGRARTVAKVDWNAIGAWVQGSTYDTPSIVTVIQEIVNRADWVAGNNLTVFIEDDASVGANAQRQAASQEHATYAEPRLYVAWTTDDAVFGREETCEDEVYIANKQNMAQLTHVFVDDGGVFGLNLLTQALPYNLLPAAPAIGDAVYFGIDTTVADSGPFASLVFDIGTVAVGSAPVWEYWDGVGMAWAPLVETDHTVSFLAPGVNSVHWKPNDLWSPTAVNLVTGYWVRARVTFAGATATQQNRQVYTIVWPCVRADETVIGGDITALAQIFVNNHSDQPLGLPGAPPVLEANKAIIALRSESRGVDFAAFLNAASSQNPAFVTVATTAISAFVTNEEVAAGELIEVTNAPAAWNDAAQIDIAHAYGPQYYGDFHVFVRGHKYAAGDVKLRVMARLEALGAEAYTDEAEFQSATEFEVLSLGALSLPPTSILSTSDNAGLEIFIQAWGDGAVDFAIYDLILMPTDEWMGTFYDPFERSPMGGKGFTANLEVDSVTYPKHRIRALTRTNSVQAIYVSTAPGPAILQANSDQKLWFLLIDRDSGIDYAHIAISNRIVLNTAQRYLSMRGSR